jgi:hypothetical protein
MDGWLGIAAILVGLVSCFSGYPLFRILMIIAGFIEGYVLGQSFVSAGYAWLAPVIGIGAAVVLALLAYPLWSAGVIVIGAALGFLIFRNVLKNVRNASRENSLGEAPLK